MSIGRGHAEFLVVEEDVHLEISHIVAIYPTVDNRTRILVSSGREFYFNGPRTEIYGLLDLTFPEGTEV